MKTFFRVAVKVALPLRPGYWWSISPWRPCLARRSRSRSRTGVYAPPMTFRIAGKQYIGFDFRLWDDGQCIVGPRLAVVEWLLLSIWSCGGIACAICTIPSEARSEAIARGRVIARPCRKSHICMYHVRAPRANNRLLSISKLGSVFGTENKSGSVNCLRSRISYVTSRLAKRQRPPDSLR